MTQVAPLLSLLFCEPGQQPKKLSIESHTYIQHNVKVRRNQFHRLRTPILWVRISILWVRTPLTLKYAKVVTTLTERLTWAEFDYDTGCASSFSPILRTGTTTKKTKYWESYLHSAQREVSWVHCSSSIDIALKLLWTLLPLSNSHSKRKRKYVCSNETICRFPFQYDYIIIWAALGGQKV